MARADTQTGGAVRGRRPKGQGPDLRQAILDAAEGLFSRHGFHGVTVRQVAAESGVDTALIHYYFGAAGEDVVEQLALGAEVVVDQRRVDAGLGRHLAHGDAMEAMAGEEPLGGVQDRLAQVRPLPLRPSAANRSARL